MTYLISLIIFGAVFFLVMALTSSSDSGKLKLQLTPLDEDDRGIQAVHIKQNKIIKILLGPNRFIVRQLRMKDSLTDLLLAGKIKMSPEEFFGVKIISAVVLAVLTPLIFGKGALMMVVLTVVGFLLPDMYLKVKVNKLREEINRNLPDVVDLLSLCVGAGLSFTLALKWVTEKAEESALIVELKTTLKEINVGKPRREALHDMARRLHSPDVARFVRTIVQAEKMGTSIGGALNILAEDSRAMRFRRGERIAIKAPLKMLFPLIFCIMPVVLILVAAPIFLRFMQGGMGF